VSHDDFKFEAQRGLPEALPAQETLLWQGAPDWKVLAVRSFHVRKLAAYFAVLLVWQLWNAVDQGAPLTIGTVATELGFGLILALLCLAVVLGIAWGYGRTTVYSITSRRVIIRSGIALQVTINIPFRILAAADMKRYAAGSSAGEIPMQLQEGHKVSYIVMWPNVRPWKFLAAQPMFRAVNDVTDVADLLADAVAGDQADTRLNVEGGSVPPHRPATPISEALV